MRGLGYIPTRGNFFAVVNPLMSILTLMSTLYNCEKLDVGNSSEKSCFKTKLKLILFVPVDI